MPFDDDDKNDDKNDDKKHPTKSGLKQVSSQKSIFDSLPKKPTAEDFDKKVKQAQDRLSGYNQKVSELIVEFKKILKDKTIPQNKNPFSKEIEREVLSKMIQLATEINNDPIEQEGMGSLGWIALLLSSCLSQRDRINELEYSLSTVEKKIEKILQDIKSTSTKNV